MVDTSAMAVINCINELLKVFSCFVFSHAPVIYLVSRNGLCLLLLLHIRFETTSSCMNASSCQDNHKNSSLTILSNSSPPVTNSRTIYILFLLPMTCVYVNHNINYFLNKKYSYPKLFS